MEQLKLGVNSRDVTIDELKLGVASRDATIAALQKTVTEVNSSYAYA